MNVRDNMGFGLKIGKMSKKDIDARVEVAADILGILQQTGAPMEVYGQPAA